MSSLTFAVILNASMVMTGAQNYDDAYKVTQDTGRPLLVMVGAEWCPACQRMKHTVLPQLQQSGGLDKVSFAVVNTDQQSALAGQLMQGASIPQLIVYTKTSTGWKRDQLTGVHTPEEVTAFINTARAASDAPTVRLSSRVSN